MPGRLHHGAELDQLEMAAVQPDASLAEEHRAARAQLHRHGDRGEERRERQQPGTGADHVDHALGAQSRGSGASDPVPGIPTRQIWSGTCRRRRTVDLDQTPTGPRQTSRIRQTAS